MYGNPEYLPLRTYRLEASYTSARLEVLEETRALAADFQEAADKFALLEQEESQLGLRRMRTQAQVETADDAWDDTIIAFRNRLMEIVEGDTEAELYRQYFTDIPSHVTSLSYAAEILISKELEAKLTAEEDSRLAEFGPRLEEKREQLEAIIKERTHLEVEEARFSNRVDLAKQILGKLQRVLVANLDEIRNTRQRDEAWVNRFFFSHNVTLEDSDYDGAELSAGEDASVYLLPESAPN